MAVEGLKVRLTAEHSSAELNGKSGKPVANQTRSYPKDDSRYWLPRLFKPRNDRGDESPHYSMRIALKGRRMAFALGTGNKEAGAKRACGIYADLQKLGTVATLAKHRTQKREIPVEAATVGVWILAAEKVFDGKPSTFGGYARCLRAIVSDVLAVAKTKKRFGRTQAKNYRRSIDEIPLASLTPQALQAWRIQFVKRAGANPMKQRAARISCNSMLRQARSLFSKKTVKFVAGVAVPSPLPFAGVEFYPRENMRYQSKIDPAALIRTAQKELQATEPEVFKAMLLAIGAGLRRGEIDRLLWRQIDFDAGVIHVETTEAGGLKSAESSGDVEIDKTLATLLRGLHAKAKGIYVIECGEEEADKAKAKEPASRAWGQRYRADGVLNRLNGWLRANGVQSYKPLHTLRKEAGSMIATKSGIYAASRFLRHADIQVTSMHYADHKERVTVDMGALVEPVKRAKPSRARKAAR